MKKICLEEGAAFDVAVLEREGACDAEATAAAATIIAGVVSRGDAALRDYSLQFDRVELGALEVTAAEFEEAATLVDDEFVDALQMAAANIEDFHRRQLTQSWFTTGRDGRLVGQQVTPLERVGIYVPGGRAQYPSTVLMNAVPAHVAGVEEIIMCTPPQADGKVNPHTLVAAAVAGVDRVFKVGGAQAVAAMAYGTESVPRVSKITGPGNAFVAAAKKLVSGNVGIDMIAGPSEVLVCADETAIPEFVAIDLMAQAEHDPKATCYFVTTCPDLVDEVEGTIAELLEQSERAEITAASLEHGLVVVCHTLTQMFDAVNAIAPEHLELHMSEPFELLGHVKNAGAIFLGPWTPESVGDYVAGPNHTLPTSGTAAYASPLSVDDFVKISSVLSYRYDALEADAAAIMTLAEREGLWAHGRAVDVRLAFMEYAMEGLLEGESCDCGDPNCSGEHAEPEPEEHVCCGKHAPGDPHCCGNHSHATPAGVYDDTNVSSLFQIGSKND